MKTRLRKKLGKKGFTLVEIMIVVAIIGLLAAIAIPNLLRARVNSNDGAVQGDLRAFSTAAESMRAATSPPQYPQTTNAMTVAAPPYLASTWDLAVPANQTKHGHTLAYAVAAVPAQTYSLMATRVANSADLDYCIDHTGVLVTSAGGAQTADATGCTNGTPVAQ